MSDNIIPPPPRSSDKGVDSAMSSMMAMKTVDEIAQVGGGT